MSYVCVSRLRTGGSPVRFVRPALQTHGSTETPARAFKTAVVSLMARDGVSPWEPWNRVSAGLAADMNPGDRPRHDENVMRKKLAVAAAAGV